MVRSIRRRSFRGDPGREAKAATFSLPPALLAKVDEAVANGAAPNKTAFVESALRHHLAQIRRLRRRALLEEAKRDPLFLRDIEEVERDFALADAETAREII
jgi:Arc/MetJ-type ribon-helix-helix transcriptional regulator